MKSFKTTVLLLALLATTLFSCDNGPELPGPIYGYNIALITPDSGPSDSAIGIGLINISERYSNQFSAVVFSDALNTPDEIGDVTLSGRILPDGSTSITADIDGIDSGKLIIYAYIRSNDGYTEIATIDLDCISGGCSVEFIDNVSWFEE